MNAAEAERIRERSASSCRDNVGPLVAEARYQTAILSTCSRRHVSAIGDPNGPDRRVAPAGAVGSGWCGTWRAAFSGRGKNELPLRDMAFAGGPGDLAQHPGHLRGTRHFQWCGGIIGNGGFGTAEPYLRGRRNVVDTTTKVKSIDLVPKERRNDTPVGLTPVGQ